MSGVFGRRRYREGRLDRVADTSRAALASGVRRTPIRLDKAKDFVCEAQTLIPILDSGQPTSDRVSDMLRQYMDLVRDVDIVDT